jgi:ketosteroid isomerase-like protein
VESSAQSAGRNRHDRHHHVGPVLAEFIAAVNAFDENAIEATFAEDALVNDVHREFWGREAIRRWLARELVGNRVTVEVTEILDHAANWDAPA